MTGCQIASYAFTWDFSITLKPCSVSAGVAAPACPCSQSASCAVTSSTTASSPGSMMSNTDAAASAQSVSGSQLSTAALSNKLTAGNGNTAVAGQGPLTDAVLGASNQESHRHVDTTACDTIVAKAGLLLQHVMHPAALLTVFGLQHHQHQGTQVVQTPPQLPQSAQILSTSNKASDKAASSSPAPASQAASGTAGGHAASALAAGQPASGIAASHAAAGTAAGQAAPGLAAGRPAFEVAAEVCPAQPVQGPQHLLSEPATMAQASSSALQHQQQQQQQRQQEDLRPSLLAVLGLAGCVSSVQGVQVGTGGPEDQEEDVRQRVARLGGIVMNLVEVFLNSLVTHPEVLIFHLP